MSLAWFLLGLRILATIILYTFLGVAFFIVWRDLKQTAAQQNPQPASQDLLRAVADKTRSEEQTWLLKDVTWLGRAPINTVVLEGQTIAARHACLHRQNGMWWLEDLGSPQGTRLNKSPVSQATLVAYGDEIEIGNYCLRLEMVEV